MVLASSLCAQERKFSSKILDGVYIKENTPTRRVRYPEHHRHRGNGDFYLAQERYRDTTVNCNFWSLERPIEMPPFKIKDCVYFNPARYYTCNSSSLNKRSHCFILEGVKYSGNEIDYTPETILPNSIRFYIDPEDIIDHTDVLKLQLDSNFNVPKEEFLTPFYFRKFEVTNGEYREFVEYVWDSTVRITLVDAGLESYGQTKKDLNGKTIYENLNFEKEIDYDDPEIKEIIETLYFPEQLRFYGRIQRDTRKMWYRMKNNESGIVNSFNNEGIVQIYPDTLVWVNDFEYPPSKADVLANLYFWHPAYSEYPVVGVSYYEALAFLEWKSIQHRKSLKNSIYTVTYDLPSDAQWDIAATATLSDKEVSFYDENYDLLSDNSWVSDLELSQRRSIVRLDSTLKTGWHYFTRMDSGILVEDSNEMTYTEYADKITHKRSERLDRLYISEEMFSVPVNIDEIDEANELIKMNMDDLGICFMGGNVSEWLKDSYQESYRPILQKRLDQYDLDDSTDLFWFNKESYYKKGYHFEGNLVRGANWYDQRYGSIFGKNVKGMHAKTFVNPYKAHATLGFRYVILVEEKREIND